MPQSLICLGDNGLIQSASGYYNLDFTNGKSQKIFEKMEPAKLSMTTMSCFDQFLIEGPGNLGVFLTQAGLPGRPPIQLWGQIIAFLSTHDNFINENSSIPCLAFDKFEVC